MNKRTILFSVLAAMALGAQAKVRLPHIICDNMVLQQQTDARLWGWAKAGKEVKVTASWDGKTIADLHIREKYGVTVIFILHDEGNVTPLGSTVCHAGSTVVLGGPMDNLETLMARFGTK